MGITTKEYYNALNGQKYNNENLKLGFNRDYTAGYFDGNGKIISNFNNHIGIKIGKIEKVNLGKKFNEIYFSSNKILSPKSTFKIFNNEIEKATISAYDLKEISKNKYLLTTTQKVSANDSIHLILDNKLKYEKIYIKSKYSNLHNVGNINWHINKQCKNFKRTSRQQGNLCRRHSKK